MKKIEVLMIFLMVVITGLPIVLCIDHVYPDFIQLTEGLRKIILWIDGTLVFAFSICVYFYIKKNRLEILDSFNQKM